MVLPGGGVFILYYNEARILDEHTFETLKEFPIIPGAITGGGGGRTYPLEGTAVMLPLHAPYTEPVQVLTCGGSTPGAGLALDNCVSIAPEVDNSTWTLERMVSINTVLRLFQKSLSYIALQTSHDVHGRASGWNLPVRLSNNLVLVQRLKKIAGS